MVKIQLIDLLWSLKVKSEMSPHLKINFMVCRNSVQSFTLLSQNAHNLQYFKVRLVVITKMVDNIVGRTTCILI